MSAEPGGVLLVVIDDADCATCARHDKNRFSVRVTSRNLRVCSRIL